MSGGGLFYGKFPCRMRLRANEDFLALLSRFEAVMSEAEPGGVRMRPPLDSYRSVLDRRAQGRIVELDPNGVMDVYFKNPRLGMAARMVAGGNCIDFQVNRTAE